MLAINSSERPRGPTRQIVDFTQKLTWAGLPADVRHCARRHFLDTLGAIVAGASGDIATHAAAVVAAVRREGTIPVPGRARKADLLDAAFLAGTAGHGIELDDGYRQGALHPGAVIVSALLPLAYSGHHDGRSVLAAMVAGYEAMLAIARTCHPDLRKRGFHPTATVGVFGSAVAAAKLLGLDAGQMEHALGIAGSSAAGLHAYVNGGADIKRLHAGHASREGLQAALLAQQGVAGPPDVIEIKDGFFQAFAFGAQPPPRRFSMPPDVPYAITQCYFKPYACCRHIQPAAEALLALMNEDNIDEAGIAAIEVETYTLAAEHAHLGWADFASSQLSFPFNLALAARFRKIDLEHFAAETRADPQIADLARKVSVKATAAMDARYPHQRPARVSVVTSRGTFTRDVDEALGAPEFPIDDEALGAKCLDLLMPVVGRPAATRLLEMLWRLDEEHDLAPLLARLSQVN